ncbi:hypothetical protein BT69DRAFT_1356959 [Atractiella rhizophila]|nr:hypothetical protein BT69DRAFT_1356959 [Atractiella rhizophila]
MDFTILAPNIKLLTKCLSCVSKFSQELTMNVPRAYDMHLSTVNSSRSAFCRFSFKDEFFDKFTLGSPKSIKGKGKERARNEEGSPVCVQAITKAILSTLKQRTTQASQAVESVSFSISDSPITRGSTAKKKRKREESSEEEEEEDLSLHSGVNAGECRIVVRLDCKHGVTKTHRLHYSQGTILTPNATQSSTSSSWSISASKLKKLMDHFQGSGGNGKDEITMLFGEDRIKMKSLEESDDYVGAPKGKRAKTSEKHRPQGTSTEVSPDIEDFDEYNVIGESIITINLKDFKAIIFLADSLESTIEAFFSTAGDPLHIKLFPPLVDIEFVLATLPGDPANIGTIVKGEKASVPPPTNPTRPTGTSATASRMASLNPSTRAPNPSQLSQKQVEELMQGIDMDEGFPVGDLDSSMEVDYLPPANQSGTSWSRQQSVVVPDSTEKDVSFTNLVMDDSGNGIVHRPDAEGKGKIQRRGSRAKRLIDDSREDDEDDDEPLPLDSPQKTILSKKHGIFFL